MTDAAAAERHHGDTKGRTPIAACPSPWLHRLHALLYQRPERSRRLVASRRAIPRDIHAEAAAEPRMEGSRGPPPAS